MEKAIRAGKLELAEQALAASYAKGVAHTDSKDWASPSSWNPTKQTGPPSM